MSEAERPPGRDTVPEEAPGDGGPPLVAGPPFGLAFFANVFPEFLRGVCPHESGRKAAVLVHLVDGTVLDLCHVEIVSGRWMAAAAFREGGDCDAMDTVFVPFESILRVTVSVCEAGDRRLGFEVDRNPRQAPT